ncbi:MAG TPA: prephenate dehydrogenase [Phaeodactylibacter sp.]|nr:prephenate dehydrogenase [Phaeodactylibacter sp.]
MTITIIGVGLIGGSMAISLKENGFAKRIIGVDANPNNLDKAIRRRLIDEDMDLENAVKISDLIIISIPVNAMLQILPKVLDLVSTQVVMDVGSTKFELVESVKNHPNRKQFVATHPMAGTEYSGPEAAIPNLFDHKTTVICDKKQSAEEAVDLVKKMYNSLKMRTIYMNSDNHDVHSAYVSHISHISSFALALTVLEKEKNEKAIFDLAGGGFSSTVRLAKSSAQMWTPVFQQNRDNVLDVLDEHINSLSQFRTLLIKKDFKKINELIEQSNEIRRVLRG